ncbi:glycosyltransferase [Corynebacterium suicordis]|nr:glycosyltransferase [Corynebacterium suicordis]MDR6277820.1 UDP:flavonoid glycosyltransferase YjiC (YdhE family) [Corynebacterium suicordis]
MSEKQLVVGMYAHHQGSGHLNRCRSIARRLAERGARVEIFSSALGVHSSPSTPHPVWSEHQIPLDFDGPQGSPSEVQDPQAGDTLHWAPLQHPGYRERMAVLAAWIRSERPDVFYVDVSVEVALFVRLLGVPVINIAMPGERWDAPHQLGYAQAAGIIAAWPQSVPLPTHLQAHAARVQCVGGISTFEDSVPEHIATERGTHRVLVMQGTGGTGWAEDYWDTVQQACPEYQFTFLGGEYRSENPLVEMAEVDVVVSAAGQNSVADIALSGKPCVLLPQERAFAEQFATARAAESLGLALNREEAPAPEEWPALLREASQMTPNWEKWQVEGAADRAAERILAIAKENRSEGEPA